MREYSFKEYVEKINEFSQVVNELLCYNYKSVIPINFLLDLDKEIAPWVSLKKDIDNIKADYSSRVHIPIDDVAVRFMDYYFLVYPKQDNRAPYCYRLDEISNPVVKWKSSINDKLVYTCDNTFMVAIANETLEENCITGYTCCLMKLEQDKIRRIPSCQIEDVNEFYDLNEQLVSFKLNNDEKISIYDKKINKFIIKDVDYLDRLEEDCGDFKKNECFYVTKILSFDEINIICCFYIDNNGNIISDMIDSLAGYYIINDKSSKENYVDILENKFETIKNIYQNKGYQYVMKINDK